MTTQTKQKKIILNIQIFDKNSGQVHQSNIISVLYVSPMYIYIHTAYFCLFLATIFEFFSVKESNMKPLIRRFARVADSSSCNRIRSGDIHHPTAASSSVFFVKRATDTSTVPSGHVPVNVGDEMERFVVSAELLNHPVFIGLLNRSAQEYGYAQKGVLHIPCNVFVFEQVVETLRSGNTDLSELIALLCGDDLSETTEQILFFIFRIWWININCYFDLLLLFFFF